MKEPATLENYRSQFGVVQPAKQIPAAEKRRPMNRQVYGTRIRLAALLRGVKV